MNKRIHIKPYFYKKNILAFFFLFTLLLMMACSKGEREGLKRASPRHSGSKSHITIYPSEPKLGSTLSVSFKNAHPSEKKLHWLINGTPIEGEDKTFFNSTDLNKGDVIQVKVESNGNVYYSNTVTILNTPPLIQKSAFYPLLPKRNDTIEVIIQSFDRDGDTVDYTYEWFINEEPAGEEPTLEASFQKGDHIAVNVIPFDDEESGKMHRLETVIHNSEPFVSAELKDKSFENNQYKAQVIASDPDGDTLRYSIEEGPKGLKIDPSKGVILWDVTQKDAGNYKMTAVIEDSQGVKARMPIYIRIGFRAE